MGRSLDFNLADFDTVALLTPVTHAADEWVAGHLPSDLIRWGGGIAIDVRNVAQGRATHRRERAERRDRLLRLVYIADRFDAPSSLPRMREPSGVSPEVAGSPLARGRRQDVMHLYERH